MMEKSLFQETQKVSQMSNTPHRNGRKGRDFS